MLAAGFGPGPRAAAAARLYLRRWQAAHQALPPALARFLLGRPAGGLAGSGGRQPGAAQPDQSAPSQSSAVHGSVQSSHSSPFDDYARLMAWLLYLRQAGSGAWRGYVDHLPQASRPPRHAAAGRGWLGQWRWRRWGHRQSRSGGDALLARAAGPCCTPARWLLRRMALDPPGGAPPSCRVPQGEDAPPLPWTFSEAELRELQCPGLEAAARHHRRKLQALHDRRGRLGGPAVRLAGRGVVQSACCLTRHTATELRARYSAARSSTCPCNAGCSAAPAGSCAGCGWRPGACGTRCGRPPSSAAAPSPSGCAEQAAGAVLEMP